MKRQTDVKNENSRNANISKNWKPMIRQTFAKNETHDKANISKKK